MSLVINMKVVRGCSWGVLGRVREAAVFFLILQAGFVLPVMADEMVVTGYVENAWFKDHELKLRAKLDSGAKTSSINSPEYEVFKRNGKNWVRFDVSDGKGHTFTVERKLVRFVRIRRAGSELNRRPVIKMEICVGGKSGVSEFTLADRSTMNYPVIIGRTFMAKRIVVDSGRAYLASGKCKQDK